MYTLTSDELKAFHAALDEQDKFYDSKECMLAEPFKSPGYHTKMAEGIAHSTRSAFAYAVRLLDGGREADRLRAIDVLTKAVSLQDTDPANPTYGIWSWYLEEPLWEMTTPDWNWADFCGKEICFALRDHGDRLPNGLHASLTAALRHACMSIFRRNMNPDYTNISIMGAYVTLAAGELCGWNDIFAYGKSRLIKLHAYNMAMKGLSEYNSPTYTNIAIVDLTRMATDLKDPECVKLANELLYMAWGCVARHYHAPTGAWAGPHYRAYTWLESNKSRSFLARGTGLALCGKEGPTFSTDWIRVRPRCPEELLHLFKPESLPRDASETLAQKPGDEGKPRFTAQSWLDKTYAFSSFARIDTWNQRRTLFGHFGTQEKPGYVAARMLHDGYDFASGFISATQYKGGAVFVQNFITDGGDTHITLSHASYTVNDRTISARDMRVRFELGGPAVDGLAVKWVDGGLDVALDGARLRVKVASALWGDAPVSYEVSRQDDKIFCDIVYMHSEKPQSVPLYKLANAHIAAAISLDPAYEVTGLAAEVKDGFVTVSGEYDGVPLKVISQAAPVLRAEWKAEVLVNGTDAADFIDSKEKKL